MTWRFRRSKNWGPVRVSLSRRGLGASVGLGDVMRVSLGADGKVRRSVRIPGTGAYNVEVIGSWHHHDDPAATEVISRHDAPTTRLPAVAPPQRAGGGGGRLFWGVVRSFAIAFVLTLFALVLLVGWFAATHNPGGQVTTPAPPPSSVAPADVTTPPGVLVTT